jgi:hypothetical protein
LSADGFDKGYIIADRSYIVGNLKLYFPESTVSEPECGLWPMPPGGNRAPVLLVWEAPKEGGSPASVRRLLAALASREVESFPLSGLYEHSETMRFKVNAAVVSSCPAGPG